MEQTSEESQRKIPNRQYTPDFKQRAIQLAQAVGVKQAAKQLEMPAKTLEKWRQAKPSQKRLSRSAPKKTIPPLHRQREVGTPVIQPLAGEAEAHPLEAPLFEQAVEVEAPATPWSESKLRAELKQLQIKISALEEANIRLRQDRDTLEKAAAYFADALRSKTKAP